MSDLVDIEDRVRRTCAAIAAASALPEVLPDDTVSAGERTGHRLTSVASASRRRPASRVLIAAAVVAVVGAATVALRDRSDHADSARTGEQTEDWIGPVPEAPITGRMDHSAVWTGSEMIVFGGDDQRTAGWGAAGAAAYDPVKRSWRELADPPDGVDLGPDTVWTGTEVVTIEITVADDRPDDESAIGAVYDVGEDRWQTIPDPGFGEPAQVFWTGDQVLVTGFSVSGGTAFEPDAVGVATYDPSSDRWHRLPDAPVSLSQAVWADGELIALGGGPGTGTGDESTVVALDPVTETWRTLPAPPLDLREDQVVAWTGTELVVAGGGSPASGDNPGGVPLADGATLDPSTETWAPLPDAPTWFTGTVGVDAGLVDGKLVLFHTGDPDSRSLVLELGSRRWSYGPVDPGFESERRRFATTVTAGPRLVVWGGGGTRASDLPVAAGFTYTPAH